jgi:hypothetical protein
MNPLVHQALFLEHAEHAKVGARIFLHFETAHFCINAENALWQINTKLNSITFNRISFH